jgi:hypothetical protein
MDFWLLKPAHPQLPQHYAAGRSTVSSCSLSGWVLDEDPVAKSRLAYAPLPAISSSSGSSHGSSGHLFPVDSLSSELLAELL